MWIKMMLFAWVQRVQEMYFIAKGLYRRSHRDSYTSQSLRGQALPWECASWGAALSLLGISQDCSGSGHIDQRPPCPAGLLAKEELDQKEFNFKGDQVTPQAPICHARELGELHCPLEHWQYPFLVYFSWDRTWTGTGASQWSTLINPEWQIWIGRHCSVISLTVCLW